jgi:hypothetical protein
VAVLHPATSGELTTTSERDVEGATECASN